MLRTVLVDVRPERRLLFRNLVESTGLAGPDIAEAAGAAEAAELLEEADRDVVFVEIQPVDDGLETIAAVRSRSSKVRIVVCSFHGDADTKTRALAGGADVYLDKPISSFRLTTVLRDFFPVDADMIDVGRADDAQPEPAALGPAKRHS